MKAYRVVGWSEHFENNRTREIKRMAWVPLPVKQDGDGYTELLDHPNGAAHFGAWVSIVELAAKCQPRGTLLRDACGPHTPVSMSRITRISETVYAEALPRLISIGWIETYEIPQEGAAAAQVVAMERNGTEQNRTEGDGTELPPPAALPEPPEPEGDSHVPPDLEQIVFRVCGNVPAANLAEDVKLHGAAWVKGAILETEKAGKRSYRYAQAIMQRWVREGKPPPPPHPNSEAARHTAASERFRDDDKRKSREREPPPPPNQNMVRLRELVKAGQKTLTAIDGGHVWTIGKIDGGAVYVRSTLDGQPINRIIRPDELCQFREIAP